MEAPTKHRHEAERLCEVESFSFFKNQKERTFDDLTKFVAEYFNVSACGISLVDENVVYSKYSQGADTPSFPRDYSICGHSILKDDEPLIINDLLNDNRFFDNPMLTTPSSIRFYAACNILSNGKLPIGTFCIMDIEPRTLNADEIKMLRFFSEKCMELFELKKSKLNNHLRKKSEIRLDTETELVINIISNRILQSNESLKKNLLDLTNRQTKNSKTHQELESLYRGFESLNAEISLIKQFLELRKIGPKEILSLKSTLEYCSQQYEDIEKLVTLEKDETFLGSKDKMQVALTSILKFTACKNGQEDILVSSIKSENQTVIKISSEKGGFNKEEQKYLFTLNTSFSAQNTSCNEMEIPLSKKIIDLHSGKIQIYSAENAGFSFYITLPNS